MWNVIRRSLLSNLTPDLIVCLIYLWGWVAWDLIFSIEMNRGYMFYFIGIVFIFMMIRSAVNDVRREKARRKKSGGSEN